VTVEQMALIAAWVAIVLLAFAMSGLARQLMLVKAGQNGGQRRRPSIGSIAPKIEGLPLDDGTPRILLFAERACATCERIWPALEELARRNRELTFVALYATSAGSRSSSIETRADNPQAFMRFGVSVTPFAVGVDGAGIVRAAEPVASELSLQLVVMSVISVKEGSPA
jgi:hypothetical protein